MKRAMSIGIGMALAFGTAGVAHAATTSGTVVSLDTTSHILMIQTDEGTRAAFLNDDATKIEQNGAAIALGDLKPGAKVTVTSDQMPSDPNVPMLATRVQVDEMPAAAATSTAQDVATTTGTVMSADAVSHTLTIQTDEGTRAAFLNDAATKIEQNGAPIALGDLKPGAKVTVTSDQMPSDSNVPVLAARVQVDEMPAAAATRTAQAEPAGQEAGEVGVAKHLPRTATPLPIFTLFGLASVTAGLAMRLRRAGGLATRLQQRRAT